MIYYRRIFKSSQKRQRVESQARRRCQGKVLQRADMSLIAEEPNVECKLHLLVSKEEELHAQILRGVDIRGPSVGQ